MDLKHIVKALQDRARGTPPPGGMVGAAAEQLSDRGYQVHVQESVAQGEPPLPRSLWQAQQARQ